MLDWLRKLIATDIVKKRQSEGNPTATGEKPIDVVSASSQSLDVHSLSRSKKDPVLVRGKFWVNTAEDRWELPEEKEVIISNLNVEDLIKMLERTDRAAVRCSVATALEELGGNASPAIPALLRATVDKNATVRNASLKALNTIDTDWSKRTEVQQVIPELVEALENQPLDVVNTVSTLLSLIGSSAVSSLTEVLLSDEDTVGKMYVLRVLARIGEGVEDSIPGIVKALGSQHLQVRIVAADTLTKIGPTEGSIPMLIAGLSDSFPDGRRAVAVCLGQAGAKAEPAIPALLPLLADRQDEVRGAAIEALEQIGTGAVSALIELIKTRDTERLKTWVEANNRMWQWFRKPRHDLVLTDPCKAYANLTWDAYEILKERQCLELAQEAALQVLGRIEPPATAAVTIVVKALEDPNPRIRAAAAQALGQIGPAASTVENVIPSLICVLVDRNKYVREEATEAVKRFESNRISGPLVVNAIKNIAGYLGKPGEFAVQAFALTGVASVPILIDVLASGDRVARQNSAKALGLIGPDAGPAVQILTKVLQDDHPWVQAEAKRALSQINSVTA